MVEPRTQLAEFRSVGYGSGARACGTEGSHVTFSDSNRGSAEAGKAVSHSAVPRWRASAVALLSLLVAASACSRRPAGSRIDSARRTAGAPEGGDRTGTALSAPATFANPLDLDYRFSREAPSRREAADPTVARFQGAYYLFASKSGGYWRSKDLAAWTFVTAPALPHEDYAPTAAVIDGWLYFMASSGAPGARIYRSREPEHGRWELFNDSFPLAQIDPALFVDDDGRVYLYYGCSNSEPLHVVELDPNSKLNPIGPVVDLFGANPRQRGWERRGDQNELDEPPWIEGAWMTKHREKYYLQYAAPGTEYKSYSDGVYVSDSPVGPFEYAQHNPFSSKPGGYACGAGHGSTFVDEHGNWWHIATMSVSVKHKFERRLGLFPASFDPDGTLLSSPKLTE